MSNQTTYQLLLSDREKGLKQAYEKYGKKLYGYAISVWNCDQDSSWDLVYKTLYRAADQIGNYTFENEEKFGGFLFRVFVNYLKNHFRDNPRKHTVELHENIASPDASYNEPENPNHIIIRAELEKMEDWERVLLLTRSQGMSYSDISAYVNKPSDQLKVYYGRLKKRLEIALADTCITIKNNDHGK